MKNSFYFFALAIALSQYSCKSDNSASPSTQVVEGSVILSGSTDPNSSIGKPGDFYINFTSKTLFGPKTQNAWGTGISLSGQNGSNGLNGNTILNGKGAPTNTIGVIGDFYFDTENAAIYGAKTQAGWGTPISLKPNSNTSNGIRVLIKENAKIAQNFTKFSENYNSYSINLNVGDIAQYLNKGSIIVQSRINNGSWTDDDNSLEQEFESNYFYYDIRLENGYSYDGKNIIIPVDITRGIKEGENENDPKFIASALKWMNTFNIQFKVTLIPADKIETISKKFNTYQIDNNFLSRYFMLQK